MRSRNRAWRGWFGSSSALLLTVATLGLGPASPATAAEAARWEAHCDCPGWDSAGASGIAASPDGTRVFVSGWTPGSETDSDYATLAYDAESGARSWAARYNGPGNGWDRAYSLAVGPDGARVYVTGGSYGSGSSSDYATLAYDSSSGTKLWEARYDGPGNRWDRATSLAVGPDGARVYVTGRSVGSGTKSDYATIAYDASVASVPRATTAPRRATTTRPSPTTPRAAPSVGGPATTVLVLGATGPTGRTRPSRSL
ncbi:MAG: hypothetical protein HY775_05480 [Acidobacteria bacterium]|nr:hypothetical protein [Acidobacteriota bacterium]